jgi:hypothetical protein
MPLRGPGSHRVDTDEQRDIIDQKLAESRRLGKEADKAGDKAIASLKRAARSGRHGSRSAVTGRYVSVDARAAAS